MKTVIIEDEQLIARELEERIRSVAPDLEVVERLPSLKTARRWFMNNAQPDLLFMDIQLSDGVSFQLFEEFELTCPVIFTTAYDEYAIRAFKVNGVDYLLKPVEEEQLAQAIARSRRFLPAEAPAPDIRDLIQAIRQPGQNTLFKEKFIVQVRNQWIPIKTSDIALFLREKLNYLFTFSGEKYILDYTTLEEVEELLDPRVFYRANRQAIIHVDAIQTVRLHENQKLTLHTRAPLKLEVDVSREKAPVFKKWFDR